MPKHHITALVLICAMLLCACGQVPIVENTPAPPVAGTSPTPAAIAAATPDAPAPAAFSDTARKAKVYAYCESRLKTLLDNDVTSATVWLANITGSGMPELILSIHSEKSGAESMLEIHTWEEHAYAPLPLPAGKALPEALCDIILPYAAKETGEVVYIAVGGMHHNSDESQEYIAIKGVDGALFAVPLFAEETQRYFTGDSGADTLSTTYTVEGLPADKQAYDAAFQSFFDSHEALAEPLPQEWFFHWEGQDLQTDALEFMIDSYFQLQAPDATQAGIAYRHFLAWYYGDYGLGMQVVLADLDFDGEQEILFFTDPGGTGGETYVSIRKWQGHDFEELPLPPSLYETAAFGDGLECYKNKDTGEKQFVIMGGMKHAYFGSEEWIGFVAEDGALQGISLFSKKYEWDDAKQANIETAHFVSGKAVSAAEYDAAKGSFLAAWEKTDYDGDPVQFSRTDSYKYRKVLDHIQPMLTQAYG